MSRDEFNIEKGPPSQARIDAWHANAQAGRPMYVSYIAGYMAIGLAAFLGYQRGVGAQEALMVGAGIASLLTLVAFFHFCERLEACEWLEPVSTVELEEMVEFFKSDNLAPAVTRYHQEVIAQNREFCLQEFFELKSYNREWIERCRIKALKSEVYSAGDSQAST